MDFIVKQEVFGSVHCWMRSEEWQKREVTIDCYGKLFYVVGQDHFMKNKVINFLSEGSESKIYQ